MKIGYQQIALLLQEIVVNNMTLNDNEKKGLFYEIFNIGDTRYASKLTQTIVYTIIAAIALAVLAAIIKLVVSQ